jgi:predicted Rossmann-fold nucleotide-binding protein
VKSAPSLSFTGTKTIIMENNLCIYCGSAPGVDARFAESARRVGQAIATHGFGLVYGGGNVGLMGIVADVVLERGADG